MTLTARLRTAPIAVPTLLAVAVLLAWVPQDAGQPLIVWVPGALALLGLLLVAVVGLPSGWPTEPAPVRVAVALLAAYAAWSFLSLAWADDRGAALEGADRTLLYAMVFALFALWPHRPGTAGAVLGLWTGGMAVLALVTLARIAGVGDPTTLFDGERLSDPAGYPNAAAALWLMPVWPAVALAASPAVRWWIRGPLAGVAVVLAELALLSVSRGAALSVPVGLLLLVALVPGRLRHLALLVPIAAAAAAASPAVLDAGPAMVTGDAAAAADAADAAVRAIVLAALGAGLVIAVAAFLEVHRPPAPDVARRVRRTWTVIVVAGGILLTGGALVAAGGPIRPFEEGWSSFKGGYEDNGGGNRLTSGLGSDRYDFYRVALDVFADHPIAGAGADNFFQDYLREGEGAETPRNPHSLALRTLAQTGLVGAVLLVGALGCAIGAASRSMRHTDPLGVAVAAGATMAFAYWVVHGMTDWFFEWAGLGAPAFALLGLACALTPRRAATPAARPASAAPARGRVALAGGLAVLSAAAVVALAAPYLAEREIQDAGARFARDPLGAYARLERAGDLDPFSDRPLLVEGSIALRFGDLERARAAFTEALERNPRGQYATLELGAIASVTGERARARTLLDRAVALAPRDGTAREARDVVARGGMVDLTVLNRRILRAGQSFQSG